MEVNKAILVKFTQTILRQLVRILLRFGVSHGEFADLAKGAYVDVAYRYYSLPKRKQTYSRAAVITGLSRKDVMRIREVDADANPQPSVLLNRGKRVIEGWLHDNELKQHSDIPLRGGTGSFEALVAQHGGDITARAILDELVRVGAVERVDLKTVRMVNSGYIPKKNETEMLDVAGRAVTDLLRTVAHNIAAPQDAYFQRQVAYHDVPASVAQKFREVSRVECQQVMRVLNDWLAAQCKAVDPQPGEATVRVGVGLYYFLDEKEEG